MTSTLSFFLQTQETQLTKKHLCNSETETINYIQ